LATILMGLVTSKHIGTIMSIQMDGTQELTSTKRLLLVLGSDGTFYHLLATDGALSTLTFQAAL